MNCERPVSYTHLDVYKRQALLELGGAQVELAVGALLERGDGQGVAVHAGDGLHELLARPVWRKACSSP